MKTVYILEDGEYSDYRVEAIFSTREKAEAYQRWRAAKTSDGEGKIVERNLDDGGEAFRKDYGVYRVYFKAMTGDINKILLNEAGAEEYFPEGQSIPSGYCVSVIARDEKHAIKIANEKRLEFTAMREIKNAAVSG